MSHDNDEYDDGMVLIAGVLYDEETLEEVDNVCFGIHNFVTVEGGDPVTGPAECTECGAEDEYDWPPVDLNPEGDPTRNGAFR